MEKLRKILLSQEEILEEKENIDVFNKVIYKLMEKGTLSGDEFVELLR